MCLVAFAWKVHPRYPLVLAANRDEFHRRATAPVHRWRDRATVLAGRDLTAGGTWLGLAASGRVAALTNYRQGLGDGLPRPSRGGLVSDALTTAEPIPEWLEALHRRGADYSGFNLVAGDADGLFHCSNRGPAGPAAVAVGVHGLSNHLLDTPWPKVERTTAALTDFLADAPALSPGDLFEILDDTSPAADDELPDTGIPRDLERLLSAPRIVSPDYGTRSSTALIVDRRGLAMMAERTFDPEGRVTRTVAHDLQLHGWS